MEYQIKRTHRLINVVYLTGTCISKKRWVDERLTPWKCPAENNERKTRWMKVGPKESEIADRGALAESGNNDQITLGESTAEPESLFVGPDAETTPVLSVIIPTKNEEAGIRECLEKIERAIAKVGLSTEVIVSDSSTDRTPEIARNHGALVVNPDKPGYGYAYRYAFEFARGDYFIMGDADTTYDFEEIPRLLSHLQNTEADIVLGSRLDGEIRPGSMPALHRYVGNPLLTKFLNTFYDTQVSDAHSGFRVFTREALETLDLRSDGMEFASEMIMDAGSKGLEIEEVPIVYHEREGEETLDSFRDGWRHVRFMLKNAPGYLFTVPCVLFLGIGLLAITLSLHGLRIGSVTFGLQTMVFGVLFTTVGYQVGSLAIFSSIAADPIRRPNDRISSAIIDRFTLESGATVGVLLTTMGSAVLAYSVVSWVLYGSAAVLSVELNLVAAAAVILGLQTFFNSFFVSLVIEPRE